MTGAQAEREALKGRAVRRKKWKRGSLVRVCMGHLVVFRDSDPRPRQRRFFAFTDDHRVHCDWEFA